MALGRRMLTLTLAMSLGALMFVQLEGSGGGGVGGLFTRVEKPTDASSVRPLVLIDTPILDSAKKATMTKTMQVHEKGLRPKAKATEEDPLLFRHRYQHHDSASNRLLYYQYETKRHPHVVVLDDIGVQSCEAASSDDHTEFGYAMPIVEYYLQPPPSSGIELAYVCTNNMTLEYNALAAKWGLNPMEVHAHKSSTSASESPRSQLSEENFKWLEDLYNEDVKLCRSKCPNSCAM